MGRTSIEDQFARRVKLEREYRGWSQAELATRLSDVLGQQVYPTTVAKIESRTGDKLRSIKLEEAVGLAQLFQLSVEDIVGISSTPRRGRAEIRMLLAATARHAAVSIDDASGRVWDALQSLVQEPQLLLDGLEGATPDEVDEFIRDARLAGFLWDRLTMFIESVKASQSALDNLIEVTELSDEELADLQGPGPVVGAQRDAIRKVIASKLHSEIADDGSATE